MPLHKLPNGNYITPSLIQSMRYDDPENIGGIRARGGVNIAMSQGHQFIETSRTDGMALMDELAKLAQVDIKN